MSVFIVFTTKNQDGGSEIVSIHQSFETAKLSGDKVAAKDHYAMIERWELETDQPIEGWHKAQYPNNNSASFDWRAF
jgi:hypothetical protein